MTQIPAGARAALRERSQGCCEACGAASAEHAHHRQPRGAGGTSLADPHSPANLLHLCPPCHGRVEAHRDPITGEPADTYALGLHVRRGTDPWTIPVRLAHGVYGPAWWWLDHQGGMRWQGAWSPARKGDQLPTRKTDPRVPR